MNHVKTTNVYISTREMTFNRLTDALFFLRQSLVYEADDLADNSGYIRNPDDIRSLVEWKLGGD